MAPYKQPVNWLLQKIRRQGEMCFREHTDDGSVFFRNDDCVLLPARKF